MPTEEVSSFAPLGPVTAKIDAYKMALRVLLKLQTDGVFPQQTGERICNGTWNPPIAKSLNTKPSKVSHNIAELHLFQVFAREAR